MRFSPILSLFSSVLATGVLASPSTGGITRRQTVEPLDGIVEPTAGTTISPGASFPFQYTVDNFCEDGYSPLTVWIVPGPDPPTASSLNSTEEFSPGTFLAFLGSFLVKNFAQLPDMPPGPPPSTFTTPTLDASADGTTVYLAVVQEEINCPPDGHAEYGLSSVALEYSA